MKKASRIIDIVLQGNASRTETPLGHRIILVTFNALETPVGIDVEFESTAHGMTSRRRPGTCAGNRHAIFLVAPRLSDIVHIGKSVELHNGGFLEEIVFAHVGPFLFVSITFR